MEITDKTMAYLPFEMDDLTDELIKKAEIELGETNERRKTALKEFRALVKGEENLYVSTDDYYLLQFLRPKKFDVKKAMARLQSYYNMKKSSKEVFAKRSYDCIIRVCQDKIANVMPYRDENGCIICLIKVGNWNYREMPFVDLIHAFFCIVMGCIDLHPATQICGIKLILDVKNMSLNHIVRMPPKVLHIVARVASVCAPVRIKAVHVINESVVIPYCWSIMKLLLSEKIKNRVHFHSKNVESLMSKINSELLPEEIGGTLKYNNTFWVKFAQRQSDLYDKLIGYGYQSRKHNS